jgi:hypothetical protein
MTKLGIVSLLILGGTVLVGATWVMTPRAPARHMSFGGGTVEASSGPRTGGAKTDGTESVVALPPTNEHQEQTQLASQSMEHPGFKGFWAIHENLSGGVVVYVSEGMRIADANRRQRMVCIMCLLPSTDEPAGCTNSRPFEDSRAECGIGGGVYSVRVRPRDALLWRDVYEVEDIVIEGDEVFR